MTTATCIVSGGSRGLGLATVERLLARGDRVATFSRTGSPALDALAADHPEQLHAELLDGADTEAVRGFVTRAAARFGGIDHCIANAAIAAEGVLATTRDDQIDALLALNVKGTIVLVRECVRLMLVRPADRAAPTVVVVSSVVASRGSAGLSVYAATKAALEGFARSLARELGPRGIRVNAVAPGFLATDLSASLPAEDRDRIVRRTPLGRLGTPADVVGAIDFLTSARAGFITGQVLAVDGGA
jgi:3-oxoacyl-[acyl-carrier protein] reductase